MDPSGLRQHNAGPRRKYTEASLENKQAGRPKPRQQVLILVSVHVVEGTLASLSINSLQQKSAFKLLQSSRCQRKVMYITDLSLHHRLMRTAAIEFNR